MDSASYLGHLRRDLSVFGGCLAGDLAAPVEPCGDWTLYDLADHLGQGNLWAAVAVTEKRGDYEGPAAPRDPAGLATWFSGTAGVLLAALETDPSTSAWTIAPPPTAGFWQRRRCLETLVHRWDAQHALGIAGQLDPALADDGVAEVVEVIAPRQVRLGRSSAPRTRSASAPGTPVHPGFSVPASPWPPSRAPRPACCSCCGAGSPPITRRSPGKVTAGRPRLPWAGRWSPERRGGQDVKVLAFNPVQEHGPLPRREHQRIPARELGVTDQDVDTFCSPPPGDLHAVAVAVA